MRNMSAYDDEIPKLDSTPPESEEVTRVGTRDEIARALSDQNAPASNNLPTPPVPPPDAEMRASLGTVPGARLSPPPADLVAERAHEMPTKPPVTGVVTESDIEDAFRDTSLEDGAALELDATALEPAPASAAPTVATAPPLPPRANVTAPLRRTPAEPAMPSDMPRAPSMGTGTLKMQAQPRPVVPKAEAGEGESGARLKRAPRVDGSPGSVPEMPAVAVAPTPGAAFAPAPAMDHPPATEHAGEPLIKRNPALSAVIILGVIAFLVGLFLLRR